jgi:hypothetical protein
LAEAALRLLLFEAVPDGLNPLLIHLLKHFLGGGIAASLLDVHPYSPR